MQIGSAKKEELALLIKGLRAIWVADQADLHEKLLAQLESELRTRYGVKVD